MPNDNNKHRPVELLLDEDDFGQPAQVKGGAAIGLVLSNLFKTPKGTIPDAPEVSIFLKDIATGVIDDTKIVEIQNTIKNKLNKFLPDLPFTEVEIIKHTSDTGDIVLLIGVKTAEDQYVFKAEENKDYAVEDIVVKKEEE